VSEFRFPRGPMLAMMAALVAASMFLPAAPARCAEGVNAGAWNTGAQWLSVRFGYARERGDFVPNGNVGGGIGYSRMVSPRLSLGGNIHYDLLGKYGGAALIALPVSIEALWHFHWGVGLAPYTGAGMTAVYRKTYRSGDDHASFQPGYSFTAGANAPIDASHLIGVDLRASSVANEGWSQNPAFGTRRPTSTLLSAKLTYTLTY